MLLFEDDLDRRQAFTARLLEAQARFGLGEEEKAAALYTVWGGLKAVAWADLFQGYIWPAARWWLQPY